MSELKETEAAYVAKILLELQDLEHQVKSQIDQAYWRANLAIECRNSDELRKQLYAIRGLCGKARQVLRSMRVSTGLTQDGTVKAHWARLTEAGLVKMAIEAVTDAEVLTDPRRQLYYSVHRDSFRAIDLVPLWGDLDLIQQSLWNLIDNASKYSYSGTEIVVKAGTTKTGRFYIAVVNYGLPIYAGDLKNCRERGWRGERAQAVTGEGSGIGLWIVDNIMRYHGGTLEVNPTDSKGLNTLRLIFPLKEA